MTFECPLCRRVSHSRADAVAGYCGACHAFTSECAIARCPEPPRVVLGNVAVCEPHSRALDELRR